MEPKIEFDDHRPVLRVVADPEAVLAFEKARTAFFRLVDWLYAPESDAAVTAPPGVTP